MKEGGGGGVGAPVAPCAAEELLRPCYGECWELNSPSNPVEQGHGERERKKAAWRQLRRSRKTYAFKKKVLMKLHRCVIN